MRVASKPRIRAKWLTLTEQTNALDSLERAFLFIKQTNEDILAWKWVILALFGALYGFAICACRGTTNIGVTRKTNTGIDKLITFGKALELCQNPYRMKMHVHSKHLILTPHQKDSINWLHERFRNTFEHYIPKIWSIEIHRFPQIVIDVLDVIAFLVFDSGNIMHLKNSQKKRIRSIINQGKKLLSKSKLYKEHLVISKL